MIQIPVSQLEFDPNGNTFWVHGPAGTTILRIKTMGKIVTGQCDTSPSSYGDIVTTGRITICLADDAVDTNAEGGESCLYPGLTWGLLLV